MAKITIFEIFLYLQITYINIPYIKVQTSVVIIVFKLYETDVTLSVILNRTGCLYQLTVVA